MFAASIELNASIYHFNCIHFVLEVEHSMRNRLTDSIEISLDDWWNLALCLFFNWSTKHKMHFNSFRLIYNWCINWHKMDRCVHIHFIECYNHSAFMFRGIFNILPCEFVACVFMCVCAHFFFCRRSFCFCNQIA